MDELDLGQTVRGFSAGQKILNRYTFVRILGRGGMGVVWLARDDELEREVALKFLPELVVHDRAVLDDLKRETRRSLALTHHNIVRIYDFAQDEECACISMEYVDGATLSSLRVDQPDKVFQAATLLQPILELCEALAYAHHRAAIVHRDLKPANLMLTSKGELKVTDFGIARSLSDSISVLTKGHSASGTLVYMSPQQLNGEFPSFSDDIYAFGATVYELLTSKPPFFSGGIERQVCEKVPPPMNLRRSDLGITSNLPIPKNWEDCIADCLAKDPSRRPASAAVLAERLRGAQTAAPPPPLAEVPTSFPATPSCPPPPPPILSLPPPPASAPLPRPPTAPARPASTRQPHRILFVGAAVAVVLLGITVSYFVLVLRIPKQPPKELLQVTNTVTAKPTAPAVAPQTPGKAPETSTKFSARRGWTTYVNVKENLPANQQPNFVAFSFDYPTSFKVQPQSKINFVKVEKYAPTGEGNTAENFAVGYAWFNPPTSQSDSLYDTLLDQLRPQLAASFHNYKELRRLPETVDGVRGRAALFQADFANAAGTMIYGKTIVVHRPGERNGATILILGTSMGHDIKSAEDLGVKGESAEILRSFRFL
jgi:serine/threonine protein kinase